jgi:hypothetical protein
MVYLAIGLIGALLFLMLFILLSKIHSVLLSLNFIKSQNIKIMSLQDQINAALGNISADIAAGATDAANISSGIGTISTGIATLLQNAGIDGTSILSALQTLQGSADTLKGNLDSAAAAVATAVTSLTPAPATAPTSAPAAAAPDANAQPTS